MESSEASPSNSRHSEASFDITPSHRRGVPLGALLTPAKRAYFRQQAYAPMTRKPLRPYHPSTQPRSDKTSTSDVVRNVYKEKVLSLENKLAECQKELNDVTTENKTYKIMVRRQETRLKQYEATKSTLPQVMQAHDEEMRVIKSTLQAEKRMVRELEYQLKMRDDQLVPLRGECDKLVKLCRDENLDERHQLATEVERLKEQLKESEEKIVVLTRRMMLEAKNSRHELAVADQKLREALRQLSDKCDECDRLRQLVAEKHKFIADNARRFAGNRLYTYVDDANRTTTVSAASINGTSFPGLNAQMRNDPSILWPAKENYGMNSRCSTDTDLSTTPTNSSNANSSTPTLPTINKTLNITKSKRTIADCEIVSLPDVTIKQLQTQGLGVRQLIPPPGFPECTCKSISTSNKESKEVPECKCEGISTLNEESKEVGAVANKPQKKNSLSNLLITVQTDWQPDSDNVLDESPHRVCRVVTIMESPELLRSRLKCDEKGMLQNCRETLAAATWFGLFDDNEGSTDSESGSDSSKEVNGRSSQKLLKRSERPNRARVDRVKWRRSPEISEPELLREIEEKIKDEEEKSLQLKAEYDLIKEDRKRAERSEDDDDDDMMIDVEKRTKLLAALREIDSVSLERFPDDPVSGQGRKRDATIFTANTCAVPRLTLPSHPSGAGSSSSTTPGGANPTTASSGLSSASMTTGSVAPRSAFSSHVAPPTLSSETSSSLAHSSPVSGCTVSGRTPTVAPRSMAPSSLSSGSATSSFVAPGPVISSPGASSPSTSGHSALPTSRRSGSRRAASSSVANDPIESIPAPSGSVASNPVISNLVASNPLPSNPVVSNLMPSNAVPSSPMTSNPEGSSLTPNRETSPMAAGRRRGNGSSQAASSGQQLLIELFGSRVVEDTRYDSLGRLTINDRNNNNVPTTSNRL